MIKYPYLPKGRKIKYVGLENPFMKEAKEVAKNNSLDETMPGGAVIVKDREIVAKGANGSDFHEKFGCERVRRGIPTGQGYELCEGCSPDNHSEARAIKDAKNKKNDIQNADLYLWGHWWCCEWCWEKMIKAQIRDVYLLEDSEKLFNKDHSENVIGWQFGD